MDKNWTLYGKNWTLVYTDVQKRVFLGYKKRCEVNGEAV